MILDFDFGFDFDLAGFGCAVLPLDCVFFFFWFSYWADGGGGGSSCGWWVDGGVGVYGSVGMGFGSVGGRVGLLPGFFFFFFFWVLRVNYGLLLVVAVAVSGG